MTSSVSNDIEAPNTIANWSRRHLNGGQTRRATESVGLIRAPFFCFFLQSTENRPMARPWTVVENTNNTNNNNNHERPLIMQIRCKRRARPMAQLISMSGGRWAGPKTEAPPARRDQRSHWWMTRPTYFPRLGFDFAAQLPSFYRVFLGVLIEWGQIWRVSPAFTAFSVGFTYFEGV